MASAWPDPASRPAGLDPQRSALVVHDLKNRLAEQGAMLAALSPQAPDLAQRIDALRAHGAGLQQRLVTFLTLYRLEVESGRAVPDDASPARLLRAAAAQALRLRNDVSLRLDLARCPSTWVLDAHLVGLAIEAALDNALRYARREAALGADVDGDWLVLWVEDDGRGVLAGEAPASAAGAAPDGVPVPGRLPRSTGLGTALCRSVADRHRGRAGPGRVTLGARADGTGTRFEMRLPA